MSEQNERIAIQCVCDKTFRVALTLAGKHYKCPACNAIISVPELAQASILFPDEDIGWLKSVVTPNEEITHLNAELETLNEQANVAEARVKELQEKEEKEEHAKRLQPIGCLALIGILTLAGAIFDMVDRFRKAENSNFWLIGPILLGLYILIMVPHLLSGDTNKPKSTPVDTARKNLSGINNRRRIAERRKRMLSLPAHQILSNGDSLPTVE